MDSWFEKVDSLSLLEAVQMFESIYLCLKNGTLNDFKKDFYCLIYEKHKLSWNEDLRKLLHIESLKQFLKNHPPMLTQLRRHYKFLYEDFQEMFQNKLDLMVTNANFQKSITRLLTFETKHTTAAQAFILDITSHIILMLPFLFKYPQIKEAVRRIFGILNFSANIEWSGAYELLTNAMKYHIQYLAERLQWIYDYDNQKEQLAKYTGYGSSKLARPPLFRQNSGGYKSTLFPKQIIPRQCSETYSTTLTLVEMEQTYICWLRLIALALHRPFIEKIKKELKKCNILLPVEIFSNGTKSKTRMEIKMTSAHDHLSLPFPRPCHNVDVVRCLIACEDVEQVLKVLNILEQDVFGGSFEKLKNGFSFTDDFVQAESYNLRIILACGWFSHPSLETIGKLRNDSATQALWKSYLDDILPINGRNNEQLKFKRALHWINEAAPDNAIKMICEVQIVLQQQVRIRLRMHEFYKFLRCETPLHIRSEYEPYLYKFQNNKLLNQLNLAALQDKKSKNQRICLGIQHKRYSYKDAIAMIEHSGHLKYWNELHASLCTASKFCQYEAVQMIVQIIQNVCFNNHYSHRIFGKALLEVCECQNTQFLSFFFDDVRQYIARCLVNAKANLTMQKADGSTALMLASKNGFGWIAKILIENHANVHQIKPKNGSSSIFLASEYNQDNVIQILLSANANVNQAKHDGATPLWIASALGKSLSVKTLLQAKADVNLNPTKSTHPASGLNCYDVAKMYKQNSVIDILESYF